MTFHIWQSDWHAAQINVSSPAIRKNTNRKVRRWLPRKRDIRTITDEDMKAICDRLNNTPRKCLGWKTPAKVFREKVMEETGKAPYLQRQ